MESRFWLFSKLTFIFIFLVIIAGSVVRMSGSGMGCPDWPKCFGHYIPPTDANELIWEPNQTYVKKQMIIENERLLYAKKSFTSQQNFDLTNWEEYTKHDYAKFNVYHTWTEYINRLVGVLLGFCILGMLITSFFLIKKNYWLLLLSIAQLILVAFQAWLGKLTVDSNLQPLKITYHMLGAVALIIIQLIVLHQQKKLTIVAKQIFIFSSVALLILLIQILLGTQVRQEIDILYKSIPNQRELWIEQLSAIFKVHRSFSIILTVLSVFLFIKLRKIGSFFLANSILGLVILEIFAGIILAYFELPKFAQPTHLLLSMLLFAALGWSALRHRIS